MVKLICSDMQAQVEDLAEAQDVLLSIAEASEEKTEVTVLLSDGEHRLSSPFTLDAMENPALGRLSVTLAAEEGASPVVHSLIDIPFDAFSPVAGKPYYVCQLKKDGTGEYPRSMDFYLDGERMEMARSREWRNPFYLLPEERRGEKPLEGLYIPTDVAEVLASGERGAALLRMYVQWEHVILHIDAPDPTVTREFGGETYVLLRMGEEFSSRYVRGIHGANNTNTRPTFITNHLSFLKEKGNYVYDWTTGRLYVIPKGDMASHRVSYASLETLIELRGMRNFTLSGITLTGVTSKYVCDNGYKAGLFNNEHRGGRLPHAALLTRDVVRLSVEDCTFRGFGANGIMLRRRTAGAYIRSCRFENVGMSAVYVGSYAGPYELPDPRTVSDGLLREFREHMAYNVRVENSYFEHIGYDYPNCNAVHAYLIDGIKVLHNTMVGIAFSAFSSGTGWHARFAPGELINVRGVEVAYNRIHNFMDLLRDGAAIYSIGENGETGYNARFNSIHHNYVSLANSKDADRRGIYLDGSTTGWNVYDNIVENVIIPMFNQYHVTEQFTHHVRIWDLYSTTPVDIANNAPHNDSTMSTYYVERDGIDALCEKYPRAEEIRRVVGCTL